MEAKLNNVLELTAKIVSAHVGRNPVSTDALPQLIQSVYRSLAQVGTNEKEPQDLTPAVPVRKSVFPDYIVCLEDGKKLQMLKRYLQTRFGMTAEQYRQKWGLPANYPMVAPNYASHRSAIAKQLGLGRTVASREQVESEEKTSEPVEPTTRGRARVAGR